MDYVVGHIVVIGGFLLPVRRSCKRNQINPPYWLASYMVIRQPFYCHRGYRKFSNWGDLCSPQLNLLISQKGLNGIKQSNEK